MLALPVGLSFASSGCGSTQTFIVVSDAAGLFPDLPDAHVPVVDLDSSASPTTDARDSDSDSETDARVPADAASTVDAADAAPVDCSLNPKLRNDTLGHFCAFAPAGKNVCANTETCCNPSTKDAMGVFHPSFCATGKNGDATCAAQAASEGSSYTVGSAWECADRNACGPSAVCCLVQDQARLAMDPTNVLDIGNTPATDPVHPPACGVKQAYNAGGTRCRAACGANEIKLCSLSDASCAPGTVCTPFQGFFRDLGYCK